LIPAGHDRSGRDHIDVAAEIVDLGQSAPLADGRDGTVLRRSAQIGKLERN
jgi:hypothetical protein